MPKLPGDSNDHQAGGVFAQCVNEDISDIAFTQSLVFHILPSHIRTDGTMSTWSLKNRNHIIDDFAMDPSQDLLVTMHIPMSQFEDDCTVIRLHILSLTNGDKHPQASVETLHLRLIPEEEEDDYEDLGPYQDVVQVYNHLICTLHSFRLSALSMDKLTVWDWIAGTLLMDLVGFGITSCAFLSSNHLLLGMVDYPWRGQHEGDEQGRLVVCDIKNTSTAQKSVPNAFVDVCELHFPRVVDNRFIFRVDVRTHPHLSDVSRENIPNSIPDITAAAAKSKALFATAPDNRLFSITLSVKVGEGPFYRSEIHSFRFLAPLSTFLSQIRKASSNAPDIIVMVFDPTLKDRSNLLCRLISMPWSQWGPEGTRLFHFPYDIARHEKTFPPVHGSRYLRRPWTSSFSIEIYDFNGRALRRERAQVECGNKPLEENDGSAEFAGGSNSGQRSRVGKAEDEMSFPESPIKRVQNISVTSSSTVSANDIHIFSEDLETRLPYRLTVVDLDRSIKGALISEDNIILDFGSHNESTVLCF